jgi:hypothetical protein
MNDNSTTFRQKTVDKKPTLRKNKKAASRDTSHSTVEPHLLFPKPNSENLKSISKS